MENYRSATKSAGDPIYIGDRVEVDLVGYWMPDKPRGFVNGKTIIVSDAEDCCQPGDRVDVVLGDSVGDGLFLAEFAEYKECFLSEYIDNKKPVSAIITGRNKYDFRDAVSLPWKGDHSGGVYGVPVFLKKTKTDIGAKKDIFIYNLRKGRRGNYLMDGRPVSKADMINRANTFHVMETMIETYEPEYNTLKNVHGIPDDIFAAVFLGGGKDNFIISKSMTRRFPNAISAIDNYLNILKKPQWSTKLLLSWYSDELEQAKRFIEDYYGMEIDHIKESDF